MADIIFSKEAEKDFSKLPKSEQKKVVRKIRFLSQTPLCGKRLSGELDGCLVIRAWPYRIVYELVGKPAKVGVLRIQHRQGAYN